jgi:hypothetical protein
MAGRVAFAAGVFVVFGTLAVLMGRSALHDWREGRAEKDGATQFLAVQQWWPTLLAAVVAVGGSIAILAGA